MGNAKLLRARRFSIPKMKYAPTSVLCHPDSSESTSPSLAYNRRHEGAAAQHRGREYIPMDVLSSLRLITGDGTGGTSVISFGPVTDKSATSQLPKPKQAPTAVRASGNRTAASGAGSVFRGDKRTI